MKSQYRVESYKNVPGEYAKVQIKLSPVSMMDPDIEITTGFSHFTAALQPGVIVELTVLDSPQPETT
jgi:hypothetical protein